MTYQVKNTSNGEFTNIETMFDGLRILEMDGFLARGKPVNIYTAQWVNQQDEDFLITTIDNNDNPVVIRENTDIEITFIIRKKYAANQSADFDVQSVHDAFISYMTDSDVWIKSSYVNNKYVHCVCLKEYKPTTQKMRRGDKSWIMGTITMHCLNAPQT
jgi:hypothetical protein